jgi:hypothetical protein
MSHDLPEPVRWRLPSIEQIEVELIQEGNLGDTC